MKTKSMLVCVALAITGNSVASTVISFEDSAAISSGVLPALDTSSFSNTVISSDFNDLFGDGVFVEFGGLDTSRIFFQYILIASLQLDEISLFGVPTGGPISVTLFGDGADSFSASSIDGGAIVFDTSSAELDQVFEIQFFGIEPQNSISFSGTFQVPEPVASVLLSLSFIGMVCLRSRNR